MSFAYLPLYTGDYQRDTLHLSMLEHGAYLKILMYCWDQQGPAPDDDRKLAGICNARSKEEVTAVRAILEEFFILLDGGWYNKRLEAELHKAEIASDQAKIRGRMSAEARRQKYGSAQPRKALDSLSIASQKAPESAPNPPTPTPTPLKEEGAKAPLSGKPDDALEVLNYLNTVCKRNYRPVRANMDLIRARIKEYGLDTLKAVVDAKRNDWPPGSEYERYLSPDTLFNATKCAKYVGQLGAVTTQAAVHSPWEGAV